MTCHWRASVRNFFSGLFWVYEPWSNWMTNNFSVSPELVCSNPWAPGGINSSDSCPPLPTAVLCKAALLMLMGVAHSLGKAGRRILCGRERDFSTETVQGKRASAHWLLPQCLTTPMQGSCGPSDFGKGFLSVALLWFPSSFPTSYTCA